MSAEKQAQNKQKATAKQRSQKLANQDPGSSSPTQALIFKETGIDINSLTPKLILQLQRSLGNQAMIQLLAKAGQQTSKTNETVTDLPDNLKNNIEELSGLEMDDVKVHHNSDKPTEVQARAFTAGKDIHLAPGQEKYLAHEAWHVVQQKQGRVKSTKEVNDIAINDNVALEQEADEMGTKALQMNTAAKTSGKKNTGEETASIIQRAGDPKGLMKQHTYEKQTYHHIIPENKLEEFWELLVKKNHIAYLKTGLKSVVSKGYQQLDTAISFNMVKVIEKEFTWIPKEKYTESFLNGLKTAIIQGDIAIKDYLTNNLPNLKLEKKDLPSNKEIMEIKKKLSPLAKARGDDEGLDVTSDDANNLLDNPEKKEYQNAAGVVKQMLLWMPGNIHIGPTNRLTPDMKILDKDLVYNKNLDDGGKDFEEAAKQVVPQNHFKALETADNLITQYLKKEDENLLTTLNDELTKICGYNVTEYDDKNWVALKGGYFRLKAKI